MRKILTILSLAIAIAAQAQKHAPVSYTYFVAFTDKEHSSYSLGKPLEFLSAKALQRRTKFGIQTDVTDLPVNESYINKVCESKIHFKNASKWLNGILVTVEDTGLMEQVAKNSFVSYVLKVAQYNHKEKSKDSEPKDGSNIYIDEPSFNSKITTSLNIYGKSFEQIKMMHGIDLHRQKYNGNGVIVAVLDAGFFNADKLFWFKKLQKNNQIVVCKDFVDNDNYVYDGNSHGLEVLSCMAATDTGFYIGTCPNAQFLLLRSEDAESEQMVEEINWSVAAEFADSVGADLITTSLGYNVLDNKNLSHTPSQLDGNTAYVSRAAEYAYSKGIMVVCSAGNDGQTPWRHIGFPADAPHALTVGAVDNNRVIADFSSQGPTADGRIKPDVSALGVSAAVESPYGGISFENGTSFSAPITAGLVACLMQAHANSSPQQISDAIKQSADRAEISDTLYGMGIPDFHLANIILGDSSFDINKDALLDVSYNKEDELFCFTIYSSARQTFGFRLIDENGSIIRTGSQDCTGKKFKHFYIDQLQLPASAKGYGFIIENEAHKEFIKLF
jgi:serine protease AprX